MLVFSVLSLLLGCNYGNTPITKTVRKDSVNNPAPDSTQAMVIKAFNHDEHQALDSIKKYNLDSIYNRCLSLLYVIYGNENLSDKRILKNATIGECNIRLINFKSISKRRCLINYLVFVNDSIPCDPILLVENGRTPFGFIIDTIDKEIVAVTTNDYYNGVNIAAYYRLYENALKSKILTHYINSNRVKLHPKFIHVLTELGK